MSSPRCGKYGYIERFFASQSQPHLPAWQLGCPKVVNIQIVMNHILMLSSVAVALAQYNTPAGSRCGMNIRGKVPPATGDCSISGGIFSIGFPGELMTYLASRGLSMGSGKASKGTGGGGSRSGTGPYPAVGKRDPSLPGHTIFAPSNPPNISMPFLTWGNGACGTTNTQYQSMLREIASHGYVIAADGPMSGSQTHVKDMLASIAWAKAGSASKYGKVDIKKMATMGHSCGGLEGMSVSYHNPDISLTMMFNIATFHDDKRFLLKELKAPVAWFVGNPTDMGYENVRTSQGECNSSN
jgi:hypothetical protein